MKIQFTPETLGELKRQIVRSLTETLRIMFGLDVALTTTPPSEQEDEACVRSCIALHNETVRTILVVAVPLAVATRIASNFQSDPAEPSQVLVQEVTNEIANIVVHAIRSYLISAHGLFLEAELPQDVRTMDASDLDVVSLYFLLHPQDTVGLNFHY